MKRYLIKSVYHHYDDFDIQDVCICETKELAEAYVEIFKQQIERFKDITGYILYLDADDYSDFISEFEEENVILNAGFILLFIDECQYEDIRDILEFEEYNFEKSNYLNFMSNHHNKDTIIKKYCNHYNSNLYIEELDYIK